MGQTATGSKQSNTGSLNQLTDQVMAFDLMVSAKAGVRMYAQALTEATTPDVRIMLKKHLEQALSYQEQVGSYIANRGWYNADDLKGQLATDSKKAQETLEMMK